MVKAILAELRPHLKSDNSELVLRYCSDPRWTEANGETWRPMLKVPLRRTFQAFDGQFSQQPQDYGNMEIALSKEDRRSVLHECLWDGQSVKIWKVDLGANPTDNDLIFNGKAKDVSGTRDRMLVTLQGPGHALRQPLLNSFYEGTGDEEGPVELTGRAKPLLIGTALNLQPTYVNQALGIFQVHGYGAIGGVFGVYDSGAALNPTPEADYTTYAALAAATVTKGRYVTCNALGMARHGGDITGVLTVDAIGAVSSGLPGSIVSYLAKTRGGLTSAEVDDADLAWLDTQLASVPQDIYQTGQIDIEDLIRQLMLSLGGYLWYKPDGKFTVGLVRRGKGSPLSVTATNIKTLKVQATSPPIWQRRMGYMRSWRTHTYSEVRTPKEITPKGEHDVATVYQYYDLVTLGIQSWIYVADVAGNTAVPGTDPNVWQLFSTDAGANIVAQATAPSNPANGTIWRNTTTGVLSGWIQGGWVGIGNNYVGGETLEDLKPAEGGANVTGSHNSLGFVGEGILARRNDVEFTAHISGLPSSQERYYDMDYADLTALGKDMDLTNTNVVELIESDDSGGQALRIGDNSGDDRCDLSQSYWYSFDPDALYEVWFDVEIKASDTAALLYLGVKAINKDGQNLGAGYNYLAASGLPQNANQGRAIHRGYFKGYTTANGSHVSYDPLNPKGLPDGTAWSPARAPATKFTPVALINYPDKAGEVIIHGYGFRKLPGKLSALDVVNYGGPEIMNLPLAIQPGNMNAGNYIQASFTKYTGGETAESLKPGEVGANVTGSHNALGFIGEGALARMSALALNSAYLTGLLPTTKAETALRNSSISIGANGTLSGAGGGAVTISGLGYIGELDADRTAIHNALGFVGEGVLARLNAINARDHIADPEVLSTATMIDKSTVNTALSILGNNVKNTHPTHTWVVSKFVSAKALKGGCSLQWGVNGSTIYTHMMFGLSRDQDFTDAALPYNDIDFCIYHTHSHWYIRYANGTGDHSTAASFAEALDGDDRFEFLYHDGVIDVLKNGAIRFTLTKTHKVGPNERFYVKGNLHTAGQNLEIKDISFEPYVDAVVVSSKRKVYQTKGLFFNSDFREIEAGSNPLRPSGVRLTSSSASGYEDTLLSYIDDDPSSGLAMDGNLKYVWFPMWKVNPRAAYRVRGEVKAPVNTNGFYVRTVELDSDPDLGVKYIGYSGAHTDDEFVGYDRQTYGGTTALTGGTSIENGDVTTDWQEFEIQIDNPVGVNAKWMGATIAKWSGLNGHKLHLRNVMIEEIVPHNLQLLDPTAHTKLGTVETGANVTANYNALGFVGEGILARLNSVDPYTQIDEPEIFSGLTWDGTGSTNPNAVKPFGQSLKHVGATSNWSNSTLSKERFGPGARLRFTGVKGRNLMIGFTLANSISAATDEFSQIDYAWYLTSSSGLYIYESGASIGQQADHVSWADGDELVIEYRDKSIFYYHNGNLEREISNTETQAGNEFRIMASFNTVLSIIHSVQVEMIPHRSVRELSDLVAAQSWVEGVVGGDAFEIKGGSAEHVGPYKGWNIKLVGPLLKAGAFMQYRHGRNTGINDRSFAGLSFNLDHTTTNDYFESFSSYAVSDSNINLYGWDGSTNALGLSYPTVTGRTDDQDLISWFYDGTHVRCYVNGVYKGEHPVPSGYEYAPVYPFWTPLDIGTEIFDMRCGPYDPRLEALVKGVAPDGLLNQNVPQDKGGHLVASAITGEGTGARANNLAEMNSTEGAKLTGIQDGADSTLTIHGPPAYSFKHSAIGAALDGQYPKTIAMKLYDGGIDRTASGSFSWEVLQGSVTYTNSGGDLTVTALGAKVNIVKVTATYGGKDAVPHYITLYRDKLQASNAIVAGSYESQGGTVDSNFFVEGADMSPNTNFNTAETGNFACGLGTTTAQLDFDHSYVRISTSNGSTTATARIRYRPTSGGTWVDVDIVASPVATTTNSGDGQQSGSCSHSASLIGLTAGTTYDVELQFKGNDSVDLQHEYTLLIQP